MNLIQLSFMRMGISIDGDPAVAIYLTKACAFTSCTPQLINKAVRVSGLGKTQDKRLYLRSGCTDTSIKKDVNAVRASGIILNLKDPRWPVEIIDRLEEGYMLFFHWNYIYTTVYDCSCCKGTCSAITAERHPGQSQQKDTLGNHSRKTPWAMVQGK